MKAFPLARLLKSREVRVGSARTLLAEKNRIVAACESERARLQARLETVLLERLRQQRQLGEAFAPGSRVHLTALATQRADRHVALLTDRATSVGEEIVAADKALVRARSEQGEAREALRLALRKRDALETMRAQWRREQVAGRVRNEERETEEQVLAGYRRSP